ncbi:transposase [Streptomyces sp. NPDC047042]|uniref:transposase n=1 Tax=Streptomyces sp. NPDC047042 TaxID=3154807 RepID=UPI0033D68B0D
MLGLLSATERKYCRHLAEQAGHARPGPMQRLLRYARWDADALRDDVRACVVGHLGDDGVLSVDETGFVKRDSTSAGAQRQCTGAADRIENAQVGVFLVYATERGRTPIDRRLYPPERSWFSDPESRHAAGVLEPTLRDQAPPGRGDDRRRVGRRSDRIVGDRRRSPRPGPAVTRARSGSESAT